MTAPVAPARPEVAALRRTGPALVAGMLVANVLAYSAAIALSRLLGPESYGALGAVLSLLLVLSVPAMALQQVVARRVAVGEDVWHLTRAAWATGLGLAVVCAAATPLIVLLLHLHSPVTALLAAAALAPVPLASAAQGVLQGQQRFRRLAALFVGAAALRLVLPVAAVLAGGGVTAAMAATAVAHAGWAGLGLVLARMPAGSGGGARSGTDLAREVAPVVGVIGGLLLLVNLDVLLARHFLPAAEAGTYAVGSLITKIVYWGPHVVAVAALPRLADPARRQRVLLQALGLVSILGVTAVAAAATLSAPAVDLLLGSQYAGLAPLAWAFALLGALLALVQLLLTAGVAARSHRLVLPVLVAVGVQTALVVRWHSGPGDVVRAAVVSAIALAAVGLVVELSRRDVAARPGTG